MTEKEKHDIAEIVIRKMLEAKAKMEALEAAGVRVGNNPTEAGELMAEIVASL